MQRKTKIICILTASLLLVSSLGLAKITHDTIVNAADPDKGVQSGSVNPILSSLTGLASKIMSIPGVDRLLGNSKTAKWKLAQTGPLPRVESMNHLKTLIDATRGDDIMMFQKETRAFAQAESSNADSAMPGRAPAPTAPAGEALVADAAMDTGGGGSADFSQTNVQVAGVDEGDLVKTDGEYIYSISGNKLYINKVNKGTIEVQSATETGLDYGELYLSGDKLVVAGTRYEDSFGPVPALGRMMPFHIGKNMSSYKVYDISDKKSPVLKQTFELEGNTAATRVIGDTLYFVINKYINYYYNYDSDLVPTYRDTMTGNDLKELPVKSIAYFPDSDRNSTYMIVGAMDLSEVREVVFQSYLNDGANFYMNKNSLYITRNNWYTGDTSIYKFEVNPQSVDYSSEGGVPGNVLNQYSMDEYNGYFRIATTSSEGNRITIFDRSLNQAGKTPDLAKGESIQSVRFMGDVAYMVTYLQTDPLYSVDLSDPYAPVVLDELKIPGFSTYLHPVEGNWLVGFGRHTTETFFRDENGREVVAGVRDMGQKVSLFDISDPKKLREADVMLLGQNTWSEAFNNPKALMVDPARKQFGFFMDGSNNLNSSVIKLIGVGDGKLKDAGSITVGKGMYAYSARLLYIGDTLYAVFGGYLIAYDLNSLREIGKSAGEYKPYDYDYPMPIMPLFE